MIKHTARAHILMQMELIITEIGWMTNNTVKEWNRGQMVRNTKVSIKMVKKMVVEN